MLRILVAVLLVALAGCSSTQRKALDETNAISEDQIVEDATAKRLVSEDAIIDVDPEKLEQEMIKEKGLSSKDFGPTPDHVIAGKSDGIIVDASKQEPLNDEQHKILRDRWLISATNTNDEPK